MIEISMISTKHTQIFEHSGTQGKKAYTATKNVKKIYYTA